MKEVSVHFFFCIGYGVSLKFVRKTAWCLPDQYFPVLRQNDHKRSHLLQRGVLKLVVEGPWKKLMNEFISATL